MSIGKVRAIRALWWICWRWHFEPEVRRRIRVVRVKGWRTALLDGVPYASDRSTVTPMFRWEGR